MPKILINEKPRTLSIEWSDNNSSSFNYVWLRHSARCSSGMPNDTSIKIDLLPDDPSSLSIGDFQLVDNKLTINWNDNIQTYHDLEILKQSDYGKRARRARKTRPLHWVADDAANLPAFDFSEIDSQSAILKIQIAVRDYGIARLKNVPVIPGTIAKIAENFGPIHVNNYGGVFDVKTESNVTLGSNTGSYLGPHTDESYRHAPPGISLFHCLVASNSGGESILVDGFKAAELLKNEDPESFNVLSRVPVFFQRKALPEEDMQAHGRIIAVDIDGEVEGIRFTDRTIPTQDLPEKFVEPVYKAIKGFWKIVNSEQLKYQFLMSPGDLNVFDNHRILHGRTEFDPGKGIRHLQQCSVNRDEFHNTLRTRAAVLDDPASSLIMTGGALG